MARKPIPAIEPEVIDVNVEHHTAQVLDMVRQDTAGQALASSQHDAAVKAVAAQIGYQLPADCTDPDLIQRDISANMRRTAEAMIEIGKGLIVLRQVCQQGEFLARLDVLNFAPRAAQKYMHAARKFSNAPSTALLKAANSQTKLLELLVLDDEELEELELTGQTGELSLDDVATMSVKELRAKLRETRSELKATEEISAEKTQQIESLKREKKRISDAPADQVLAQLQQEADAIQRTVRGGIIGQLRQALIALNNHGEDRGDRPTVYMAGLIGQLMTDLAVLRDEFDLPAIDADEHGWIDDGDEAA